MKISDRLYKKYGTNAVILPPPIGLEDEEVIDESVDPETEELYQSPLAPPKDLPVIDTKFDSKNPPGRWIMYDPADPNLPAIQERIRNQEEMQEKGREQEVHPTGLHGKGNDPDTAKKNHVDEAGADDLVDRCASFENKANSSIDDLLKLSEQYDDLCGKF